MSATPAEQQHAASPTEAVEATLSAFVAGDIDEVMRWIQPDVTVHEAASLSYGGTYHGHAEFLTMLQSLGSAFELQMTSHTASVKRWT